ncbi:MAG: hypothetical protein ALECFALPRED_002051 [Alectoria fallacina]|uniref:Uncharacterized protein n=1 Tax=Alectoria fallacina TaxID=1903189 RepID=A0A8H3IBS1_9LECA|nr:MAG: hypothetical protein ALECFALPRED_002051 [Alectoria fallacina]
MRLTTLLFISALSSLGHISRAFPLKPQAPAVRRGVAYSVVAVDGGSAATPPAVPVRDTLALTLTQTSDSTVTVTAPASTMPPSIEMIVAINVVSELEPTKTVDITVTQEITKTPSPTAITFIINPAQTPTSSSTMSLTSQTYTSVPTMKSANSLSTSITTPITSSKASPISIWTSTPTTLMPLESSHRASEAAHQAEEKRPESETPEAAPQTPSPLLPPHPPPSPTITSSSTRPTASSKTYDSRKWHTSYPVWNVTSTVFSSASATVTGTGRAQKLWKKG